MTSVDRVAEINRPVAFPSGQRGLLGNRLVFPSRSRGNGAACAPAGPQAASPISEWAGPVG